MAAAPTKAPVGRAAAAVGTKVPVVEVVVGREPVPVGYVPLDAPPGLAVVVSWQSPPVAVSM